MLLNIFSNAIKFTERNGLIEILVKNVLRFEGQDLLEVSVLDNGIGIKEEHKP